MKVLNDLKVRSMTLLSGLKCAERTDRICDKSQSGKARVRARLRDCEEGSNLVEFALVLPVLLLLLTGILSFGSAMMNYESLVHGVAEGAQRLATLRGFTSDPCADTVSALLGAAPSLKATDVTTTVTMNGNTFKSNTCSGQQGLLVYGTSMTVAATYPCNISVYGVSVSPGCYLSATVTEREN